MSFSAGSALRASTVNDEIGAGDDGRQYFTLTGTITNVAQSTFIELLNSSSASCGVAFVAPPSGKVTIRWGANIKSGVSGSTVLMGTAVRTGATIGGGNLVDDVVDGDCIEQSNTINSGMSRERDVDGLTPGNSYNVRIFWRNSGATSSTANKPWISTTPIAG